MATRIEEFHERHQDPDHPAIRDVDGITSFPDGCHRDDHGNLYEDVEDERCLRRKVWYWRERKSLLTAEFNSRKLAMERELQSPDATRLDRAGLESLKRLQKLVVIDCERKIDQAVWELSLFPHRTRKARIKDLRSRITSACQSLRLEQRRLEDLRQKLGTHPDDERLVEQVRELSAAVQEQADEYDRLREEILAEVGRVQRMTYDELLDEERQKDRELEASEEEQVRLRYSVVSTEDRMDFKADLESLQV